MVKEAKSKIKDWAESNEIEVKILDLGYDYFKKIMEKKIPWDDENFANIIIAIEAFIAEDTEKTNS